MSIQRRSLLTLALWLVLLLPLFFSPIFSPIAAANTTDSLSALPARPYYSISDPSKALDSRSRQTLEALLAEHDRLTGEQILIALLNSVPSKKLKETSKQLYLDWKIGNRPNDNGILLTLDLTNQDGRFEIGLGLDSVLSESKAQEIISDWILPELRSSQNEPERLKAALTVGIYEVLTTLNSPLILTGQADAILQQGNLTHFLRSPTAIVDGKIGLLLFLIGLLLFTGVLIEITSREAHFTAEGWRVFRAWQLGEWRNLQQRNSNKSIQSELGGIQGAW